MRNSDNRRQFAPNLLARVADDEEVLPCIGSKSLRILQPDFVRIAGFSTPFIRKLGERSECFRLQNVEHVIDFAAIVVNRCSGQSETVVAYPSHSFCSRILCRSRMTQLLNFIENNAACVL